MPWALRASPGKLQNVMAVTEVLALFWQPHHNQKRSTAMKKTAAIVGVAFTVGMVLTTAFAFSLLPLALT